MIIVVEINGACYKKNIDKCKLKHDSLKHLELYNNMQSSTSPEPNGEFEAVDSMLDPFFEFSDNYFHDDSSASVDLSCSSISDSWFD